MKTLFFSLAFCFCFGAFGQFVDPERIVKGNFYALIIGVADYADPNVKDLNNPVRDAQRLKNVLLDKYNFESSKVHFLENPTGDAVYEKLEFFKNTLRENDVWLVFFAGHGFWDKSFGTDGEGYWMLKDSYKNRRNTWLSNTDLKNYIASVANQHTLIIADACFSGGLVRDENFMDNAPKDIKTAYQDKSRIAMTSGSLEPVPDKSVFFKYLIEALEKNEDNYLRALNLFVKLDKLVRINADTKPIFAPIHKVGHEFGDFVFIRKIDTKSQEEAKRQEALRKQQEQTQADETAWTKAKNANTIAAYQAYINTNGKYKADAQTQKATLEKAENDRKEAQRLKDEQAKRDLPTEKTLANGMVLCYVEGRTFEMGDQFNEGNSDEKPVHTVQLDGFWIGKYEVTNAEYAKFLNEYGSDKVKNGEYKDQIMIYENEWGVKKVGTTWQAQSGYEKHPVVYVTWFGANEFCRFYGGNLPTEAQWEYAARERGRKVRFENGKDILDPKEANFEGWEFGNYSPATEYQYRAKTLQVGSFKPNSLNLYDITGNVWEWCEDWYDEKFYESAEASIRNPLNNRSKEYSVLRGGSWRNSRYSCRVANRFSYNPTKRYYDVGFRFSQVK